nr:PAS domain S-box protein [Deltaproteobacteria bacterium]
MTLPSPGDLFAASISGERDAAERLRKRLLLASEVTQLGSWDLDPATGAVEADDRARVLLGIDGAPETLDALTTGLHDEDRERVRAGIAGMLASGRAFLDDCRAVHDGAVRWIAVAADAHQGPGDEAPRVLGIVHDVSDRKRAEEEHARLVAELSRAVHVSEMFVGILGHDLRNPLSAVLAGAQILRHDLLDPRSARVVARIVSSGERMARMIEQLLDFTRARLGEGISLDRAPLDLAQLAREIVEECRAASPSASLRIAALGETGGAWDRDRVFQVLSNLVRNALQHGEVCGEVALTLDGTDPALVSSQCTTGARSRWTCCRCSSTRSAGRATRSATRRSPVASGWASTSLARSRSAHGGELRGGRRRRRHDLHAEAAAVGGRRERRSAGPRARRGAGGLRAALGPGQRQRGDGADVRLDRAARARASRAREDRGALRRAARGGPRAARVPRPGRAPLRRAARAG